MPQIDNSKEVYAINNTENLLFRERLTKRFASHEWVRVKNVDSQPFRWQYLPNHAETVEFSADGMQKATYREPVEVYELQPGESEPIIGENAYLMIEALYKKMVADKILADSPNRTPGQSKNFNWTDSNQQEAWINQIYLGKEVPNFRQSTPRAPKPENEKEVKHVKPIGRLRKTTNS